MQRNFYYFHSGYVFLHPVGLGGNQAVVHSFNSDCGSGVDEGSANEIDIVLVDGIVQQPHLKAARR